MQYDIKHLRYFVASANQGSFRKAAESIGIRESAISRRIRDLEDQIGASLFLRHSGGVNLTFAGQRFLRRAEQALAQLDEAAREVSNIGQSEIGHIVVGTPSSLASAFLSNLFKIYDAQHDDVNIEFQEGSALEHLNRINKFQMDIAFTIGNQYAHKHDANLLWREDIFIALWEYHKLSAKYELRWEDLLLEHFLIRPGGSGDEVRGYLTRIFGHLGHRPDISVQNVGRYRLLNLVASRMGVVPVLQSETAITIPGVIYRSLAGEILPFYAISSPRNDNPAARTLLSLARTLSSAAKLDV